MYFLWTMGPYAKELHAAKVFNGPLTFHAVYLTTDSGGGNRLKLANLSCRKLFYQGIWGRMTFKVLRDGENADHHTKCYEPIVLIPFTNAVYLGLLFTVCTNTEHWVSCSDASESFIITFSLSIMILL